MMVIKQAYIGIHNTHAVVRRSGDADLQSILVIDAGVLFVKVRQGRRSKSEQVCILVGQAGENVTHKCTGPKQTVGLTEAPASLASEVLVQSRHGKTFVSLTSWPAPAAPAAPAALTAPTPPSSPASVPPLLLFLTALAIGCDVHMT